MMSDMDYETVDIQQLVYNVNAKIAANMIVDYIVDIGHSRQQDKAMLIQIINELNKLLTELEGQ